MQPIVFELRDIDPDVVSAWQKYFKGVPNVCISLGEIFERSADAIVSPANSFGYMDGGIDLVYLHRFGWELQTRLQTAAFETCMLNQSVGPAGHRYLSGC
jgi:hypothetical protein